MIDINHTPFVLIVPAQALIERMAAIALFLVLVAVCVLAACFGVDSRPVEHDRHRPNWS